MSLNLDPFFNPRSVALVGASDKLSSWGFIVAHNIVQNNYSGKFFPVHPKKKEVLGYKAYPTILDIPKEVTLDLVIIIIPARVVLSILEQANQRGTKHVVIITAGFREIGEEGKQLEEIIRKRFHQAPGDYGLFDLKATKLAAKCGIAVIFIDGTDPEEIIRAVNGSHRGTEVREN